MCLRIADGWGLSLILDFLSLSWLNLNASLFLDALSTSWLPSNSPLPNHIFKYLRWCNCPCGRRALMVTVPSHVWLFTQTITVHLWIFCYLGRQGQKSDPPPRLVSCSVWRLDCDKWSWGSWHELITHREDPGLLECGLLSLLERGNSHLILWCSLSQRGELAEPNLCVWQQRRKVTYIFF